MKRSSKSLYTKQSKAGKHVPLRAHASVYGQQLLGSLKRARNQAAALPKKSRQAACLALQGAGSSGHHGVIGLASVSVACVVVFLASTGSFQKEVEPWKDASNSTHPFTSFFLASHAYRNSYHYCRNSYHYHLCRLLHSRNYFFFDKSTGGERTPTWMIYWWLALK
jgi:hypothetical protein